MGKLISDADKEVLVEIVRYTQKQGLKGKEGGWKEFLAHKDKKLGSSLSDPAKRSKEILVDFLTTFPSDIQKYFDKTIRRQLDRKAIEQHIWKFPNLESPEQRLVRLTSEHPEYIKKYSFPSHNEGWKVIPIGKASESIISSKSMVSLDCEMVLCQDGTDSLVQVCVVDRNLEVKLDTLVNPNKPVVDYRTPITGISAKDLEGITCSLVDVQKSLRKILSEGTILIGHSVCFDLIALKFDYPLVVDTSYIFKYADLTAGASPSLNNLCKSVLGYGVREDGEPHSCLNDAKAAMKLVLAKLEHGFKDPIYVSVDYCRIPEYDLAKLLIHKVPLGIPYQELFTIFTPEPINDSQADIRPRGETYSAFVKFTSAQDADDAFNTLNGEDCKRATFLVRKMVRESDPINNTYASSNKRPLPPYDSNGNSEMLCTPECAHNNARDDDSKRQRTCPSLCEHQKEIDRLKNQLREREDEIFLLQRTVSSLSRFSGLAKCSVRPTIGNTSEEQ